MKLNWWQRFVNITLITILVVTTAIAFNPWGIPQAQAILAQGDAITDPKAILRYALPIENENVRKIQGDIEKIGRNLRGKRWKTVEKEVREFIHELPKVIQEFQKSAVDVSHYNKMTW